MRDINEATLLGTVSKEVQVNQGKSGILICNIPISTVKKGWNGGKDQSTYHTVVCFGELADVAQNFKVGDRVMARGRIQNDSYEVNGEKRIKTKITASQVVLCSEEVVEGGDKAAPSGGKPAANFPRGESDLNDESAFPFQDKERGLTWEKPKEGDEGWSYVQKDAVLYACAWDNPETPYDGGVVYSMQSGDVDWSPAGKIEKDDVDLLF